MPPYMFTAGVRNAMNTLLVVKVFKILRASACNMPIKSRGLNTKSSNATGKI